MEKLQLGRKRKTDAEKPRMDPLMRALKALHSAGSPETMTPEELEHQRRNQEILGRLTAPMAGMTQAESEPNGDQVIKIGMPSGPCLLPGPG